MFNKNFKVTRDTQFAVLGLGKFGRSIFQVLSDNNFHVLGCDIDKAIVHEAAQYADLVVEGDVTDPAVLEDIGIRNFDVVIVSMSEDFEASIMTVMTAKEEGVPFVLAKANGTKQKKILESVGADWVILPEMEIGEKVAKYLISDDPLLRLHRSEHYDILEIEPNEDWVGKSIRDLRLRELESINIIAIIRDDDVIAVIDPGFVIERDDILVAVKIS